MLGEVFTLHLTGFFCVIYLLILFSLVEKVRSICLITMDPGSTQSNLYRDNLISDFSLIMNKLQLDIGLIPRRDQECTKQYRVKGTCGYHNQELTSVCCNSET
jgi:hypothetical protein